MKTITKLWIGVAVLAVLSPLGLIIPEHFKAGSAWGEWGTQEIEGLIGYSPKGLEKLSSLWKAPLPDYAFTGWEGKGLPSLSFAYILSAVAGIVIVVAIVFLIGTILAKKKE